MTHEKGVKPSQNTCLISFCIKADWTREKQIQLDLPTMVNEICCGHGYCATQCRLLQSTRRGRACRSHPSSSRAIKSGRTDMAVSPPVGDVVAAARVVVVSQGRTCSDNFTCCHTEAEVADQTFDLNQSQHTDTGPTSPSAVPRTPGAWQGSHWTANV